MKTWGTKPIGIAAGFAAISIAIAGAGCSNSGGQGVTKSDTPPIPRSHRDQQPERVQSAAPTAPTPPSAPTPPKPPDAPSTPQTPRATDQPQATNAVTKEFATGVRINPTDKFVEFDATVPINVKDPQKPRTYLEVIACPPDTKEHETVLMTRAKPSHVHAALLLLGLEPGTPGVWNWEGETLKAVPPTGPRLTVTLHYNINGEPREASPAEWVLNVNTNKTLRESADGNGWVFAGSQIFKRQGQDYYRADVDGTLIGLTTFGGETVAWTGMYNPDSGVEEPHWIANPATVPEFNTQVVVRIQKE